MIQHAIGPLGAGTSYSVPRTRTKFGDRAFSMTGPVVWNSLPAAVRHADSLHSFKRRLKSYFFSLCFNDWQCNAIQVRFRVCRALNSRSYSIIFYSILTHYRFWCAFYVRSLYDCCADDFQSYIVAYFVVFTARYTLVQSSVLRLNVVRPSVTLVIVNHRAYYVGGTEPNCLHLELGGKFWPGLGIYKLITSYLLNPVTDEGSVGVKNRAWYVRAGGS